jgi:ankyrin repeat protein
MSSIKMINYANDNNKPVSIEISNNLYMGAMALDGNIKEVVRMLGIRIGCCPSLNNNYPIRMAALGNHMEIIKILMKDGRSDPSAKNSYALYRAVDNNNIDMIKLLLTDKRVSPHSGLIFAMEQGKVEICRIFLDASKGRISKAEKDIFAWSAKRSGHQEVYKLLTSKYY